MFTKEHSTESDTVKPFARINGAVDRVGGDPNHYLASMGRKFMAGAVAVAALFMVRGCAATASDFREDGFTGVAKNGYNDVKGAIESGKSEAAGSTSDTSVTVTTTAESGAVTTTVLDIPLSEILFCDDSKSVPHTISSNTDYIYPLIEAASSDLTPEEVNSILTDEFAKLNPGINPDNPGVGTEVIIPGSCSYGP